MRHLNHFGAQFSASLLIWCVVLLWAQASSSFGADSPSSLTEEQQIVHVLNRLGFGPRLGDIERVRAMGIAAYIDQQLHPESIPDPVLDQKLAHFSSLHMSLEELIETTGPVAAQGSRRRSTVFEKRTMAQRALESETEGAVEQAANRPEARRIIPDRPRDYEIQMAKLIRAVYSERQLHEMMADFWMNHFNINFGDRPLAAHFEEQVIRRHALGNFKDLLMAVTRHPSMLFYLDNWVSSAPAEVIQARISALRPTLDHQQTLALLERMPFLEQAKGLNENFARELMELHTVGVDGGYTQEDIIELAKVLTGWTISGAGLVNGREDDGVFVFDPLLHVDGDKTVMGQTIKAAGIEEGEQVIEMLARHASTARFIATKLTRRFVADDPPQEVVDVGARAFEESGGDIREVLRAIFGSPQFLSADFYQVKIKKPLEMVASALRAVNAEIDDYASVGLLAAGGNQTSVIRRMGERVYTYEAPDGNPDVGSAWMNTNALLQRLEFANQLASERLKFGGIASRDSIVGRVKVDLPAARTLLAQLGLPEPTAQQIEQVRTLMREKMMEADEDAPAMSQSMMARGGGSRPEEREEISTDAIIVATMLGSPAFQKR